MPNPESLRQAFQRAESILAEIQRYVRDTLEPYCRDHRYLFVDRRKTLDSLSEKLEGGRLTDWASIDDLYACTVVIPVATHADGVIRKLDASFTRKQLRSASQAKKAPDVFRFDGTRWYGYLSPRAALSRQPGVADVIFEVQVVTAFEYAWMAVSHDLVYKADNSDWRRQRLAAQLRAAVEQVEVLISAFETASSAVTPSPWPETDTKTGIIERCMMLVTDGLIPDTLLPDSWRRFADNVYALVASYESNRHGLGAAVVRLLDVMDADLRGASPMELPTSGTLFQYVLSIVARPNTDGGLERFTTVPSRELSDLYHLTSVPKTFKFNGTAARVVEPTSDIAPAE